MFTLHVDALWSLILLNVIVYRKGGCLLQHGALPNTQERGSGRTWLHVASICGSESRMSALFGQGADMNIADRERVYPSTYHM